MATLAVTNSPTIDNPEEGDLMLSPTGAFMLRTELRDIVEQRIRVRLRFFKGEWFLNLDAGTPYFQVILNQKSIPTNVLRSVFAQVIQVEGVSSILELTPIVDARTRKLSLSFRLALADGTTFDSSEYKPFVVVA